MNVEPFVVTPKDYEQALPVLGLRITVLAANSQTQAHEITIQEGDEGMGPPPHSHPWDESFFVLAGQVDLSCAGKWAVCEPGTLIHVPAGTVHGFRFRAGGGRMLEVSGKGGRATQMFRNVSKKFPSADVDVPQLLETLSRNGVTVAA